MTTSSFRGGWRSLALASALGLATLAAVTGCKPNEAKKSATPSPSASSSAQAATATGPCGTYAAKVCEKAGNDSEICTNFKEATSLMSDAACTAGSKDIETTFKKLGALRGECEKLVKTLCDAVGPTTKSCTMVTTQTKQFPPARCKMMLEHVPQIIEDLKKMEAANQPLTNELQAAIVAAPVPSFGPADSKVKVVEFSDFECPFCSRAADVVHQVREKYGDKVQFVFRQFPLPMHPHARDAAEAALAADEQGKFWQFHDQLFKNQRALERPQLEGYAKDAGLDLAKFKKSLDDKKFAPRVESDMKLGEQVAVQGTPTLFVNGERVENPTDLAAVTGMIDTALAGGTPHG